jgi:integrase/recombinase XerD
VSARARPRGEGSGKKRKLPKILTREEVKALLDAPNLKAPTGLRNRCMFELMYRAGLRVGEVCLLTPRDVDLADGTIRIHEQDGAKTGDGTAYFKPDDCAPLIEEWIRVRRRLAAPARSTLFCTLAGGKVSPRYMQQMTTRMKKRAGITAVCTPHVLRHTFATELLQEGFNLREVQELMRHSDISTTEIYTHVLNTHLQDRVRRRR